MRGMMCTISMLVALRSQFKQVRDVLQEGVDTDGGYLVPEEYDSRLIDILNEENIMRNLGHKITTSGDHKINIAATKPAAACFLILPILALVLSVHYYGVV